MVLNSVQGTESARNRVSNSGISLGLCVAAKSPSWQWTIPFVILVNTYVS